MAENGPIVRIAFEFYAHGIVIALRRIHAGAGVQGVIGAIRLQTEFQARVRIGREAEQEIGILAAEAGAHFVAVTVAVIVGLFA